MKFDKQLAIILVLLSLLISAIGIAFYFYTQKQETLKKTNQLVVIYVASENIPKNTLIEKKHLKQTTIARQFILTKPMTENEIIGKYTKEPIYQNEAFLKEKLVTERKKEKKEKTTKDFKFNSYNMALDLFENPNYSLQPEDIIKIISVYPKGNVKKDNDFAVQYVANNIRVLGFMRGGYPSDKSIVKIKQKKLVKKQQIEEIVDVKANEILLDIEEKVLISLIDHYNKGKQLWMVKSKFEEKVETKEEEKKIAPVIKAKKKKSSYVPRKKSYPVVWYKPKTTSSTKTATISYADNKNLSQTKKAKIVSNYYKDCSNNDKLLMVIKNRTKLMKNASYRSKVHKTVYKNYVIPYKGVSKINPSWYLICDGSYINSEDVIISSYDEYLKLK